MQYSIWNAASVSNERCSCLTCHSRVMKNQVWPVLGNKTLCALFHSQVVCGQIGRSRHTINMIQSLFSCQLNALHAKCFRPLY